MPSSQRQDRCNGTILTQDDLNPVPKNVSGPGALSLFFPAHSSPTVSSLRHCLCQLGQLQMRPPASLSLCLLRGGSTRTPCSYLSALESPPLCAKLLCTSLKWIAPTTLETWAEGNFSSQTQEGRTLPGQKKKQLSLLNSLNCHSCPDFYYCLRADLSWRWLLK